MWLFGGWYDDPQRESFQEFNDLWRFDAGAVQWTWVGGSELPHEGGGYGQQGVADSLARPGARWGAAAWTAPDGALWLFGGHNSEGALHDLWRFDPGAGRWAWMKGTAAADQPGLYGEVGQSTEGNLPGGRREACAWTAADGSLWLFGGGGRGEGEEWRRLSDLWRYAPDENAWTWIAGGTTGDEPGSYGSLGIPDPVNAPGGRRAAAYWSAQDGAFWMFGGEGVDAAGRSGLLSDLWRFDPATSRWTWMGGADASDEHGSYGILGVPAPSNSPGGRMHAVSWTASDGALWLLGGDGYGVAPSGRGWLNDLWRYDTEDGAWTWMRGGSLPDEPGVCLVAGEEDPGNTPGGRRRAVSWTGPNGALWMLGGEGIDCGGYGTMLGDLWKAVDAPGRAPSSIGGWQRWD